MANLKFTITRLSFILLSNLIFIIPTQATIRDDYEIPDVKEFQYKDLNKYKKYHKIFSPNFTDLVNRLKMNSSTNAIITIPSESIDTELMGKALASNTKKDLFYLDFPYMTEKYYAQKEPNRLSNLFTYVPEISDNSILLINNIDKLISLDHSENYERFVKTLYDEIKDKLHKNFAIVATLKNNNTIYPPLKDFGWDKDIQLKKPTYEARRSLIKNILKDKNINCKKEDLDQFAKKTNNLYQKEIQKIIYNAIDKINTSNSNLIKNSYHQSLYTSPHYNPNITNTSRLALYLSEKITNFTTSPHRLVLTTQNFYDSLYDSPFYNPNVSNKSKLILYLFEKNKARIEENSSLALAKELADLNAKDINELIEESKFASSSNKLKLSNLLKCYYSKHICLRNQNIDKILRYPLLKVFAKKNNIVISDEELKELANNIDILTLEDIQEKSSIDELLITRAKEISQEENLIDETLSQETEEIASSDVIKNNNYNDFSQNPNIKSLLLDYKDNIYQLNAQNQIGLDCGYHAFFNGVSISNFIQDNYRLKENMENISQYDNYLNNLELFKNMTINRRLTNVIRCSIYNYLLLHLKGAIVVKKSEPHDATLKFDKGYIKLNPTEGWWNKSVDEKVKKIKNLLIPVSKALSEKLTITQIESAYYIKKQEIIDALLTCTRTDKSYEIVNAQEKIEQAFNNIKNIFINTSTEGVILSEEIVDKNGMKSLSNRDELTIDKNNISKEFNANYFDGEMLNSEEILYLESLNLAGTTLIKPNNSTLCLGDDNSEFTNQIDNDNKFQELLNDIKEKEELTSTIALHISGNHWITLVIDKKADDIKFFIADSLNISRINNEKINVLVSKISNVIKATKINIQEDNSSCNKANIEEQSKEINNFMSQIAKPTKRLSDLGGNLNIDIRKWINSTKFRMKMPNIESKAKSNLILYGVPGNGKTTLAEAIAGELGRMFIKVSVSKLGNKYRFSMANKLENLFTAARNHPEPVVILIDEIDAVIGEQANGDEQSAHNIDGIKEFLAQIDEEANIEINNRTIVIGSTNHYDTLPNTISARRFAGIEIKNPEENERQSLINFFIKDANLIDNTTQDYKSKLAKKTDKWSVSNIESMIGCACDSKYEQLYDLIENKECKDLTITSDMQTINDEDLKIGYEATLKEIENSEKPFLVRLNKNIADNQHTINAVGTVLGLGIGITNGIMARNNANNNASESTKALNNAKPKMLEAVKK